MKIDFEHRLERIGFELERIDFEHRPERAYQFVTLRLCRGGLWRQYCGGRFTVRPIAGRRIRGGGLTVRPVAARESLLAGMLLPAPKNRRLRCSMADMVEAEVLFRLAEVLFCLTEVLFREAVALFRQILQCFQLDIHNFLTSPSPPRLGPF